MLVQAIFKFFCIGKYMKIKVETSMDSLELINKLSPWESLMNRIVWKQLGEIKNKKILFLSFDY